MTVIKNTATQLSMVLEVRKCTANNCYISEFFVLVIKEMFMLLKIFIMVSFG